MVSLGAILYLVARSLPRVPENQDGQKAGILDRWASSEIPEKIDTILNGFLEKLLRKLKVILLKVDNSLAKHIKKVKPGLNGNGKPSGIDFKEMAAEKNGQNGSDIAKNSETGNN